MRTAVSALTHKWAVRRQGPDPPAIPGIDPPRRVWRGAHRFPLGIFHQAPVDVVFVEGSHQSKHAMTNPTRVEQALAVTDVSDRPLYVCEAWNCGAPMWTLGPVSKLVNERWKKLGYLTHCRWVQATQVGGAIDQSRLLVVRVSRSTGTPWEWDRSVNTLPRPMSNLLTPPGLIPRWAYTISSRAGARVESSPMPSTPGRWITTHEGTRRLEVDEFIRGMGGVTPGPPNFGKHPLRSMALRSTSVFHWEHLTNSMSRSIWLKVTPGMSNPSTAPRELLPSDQRFPSRPRAPKFTWQPPDLSMGSPWYNRRLTNLNIAAAVYPLPDGVEEGTFRRALVTEGLEMLARHRANYDSVGPKPTHLQLLWWEWPYEHWVPLREGSKMNFQQEPPAIIHENSPMDEVQTQVALEFVEELIGLGTLAPLVGQEVKSTAPLFCIPKEGQPGQWRVIADMLRGGQNSCIANEPVYLPRLLHILGGMYEGGYSASVDASKFFYQFATHPDDRPFLGIKHPVTGTLLAYHGLPMGSGNSPALGNRYGLAFIRKICDENADLFKGRLKLNGFFTAFTKSEDYDPSLGEGYVIHSTQGLAVKIWAFVDDFLIHAPTEELCQAALKAFLDASVDCGMLCHPLKLVTPCQSIRYCGFIFDHSGIPRLEIPQDKLERSGAMIDYTLAYPDREWSRLALAVLAGVLESLAECTPQRIGHTHLRALHSLIHQGGEAEGLEVYLSTTYLGDKVLTDLQWWRDHLQKGEGRVIRAQASGTLVPTFGDGSGTGTGGTIMLPDRPLTMWKGQWAPTVFAFTSNWKELTTLVLTMEHLSLEHSYEVRGTTLFYFTDNSATYWICQKGSSKHPHLHEQVVRIRSLETRMQCQLWVIHIPGKVMIQEGTDGLSRGIWITPLQEQIPREVLMPGIFAPMPFDPILINYYVREEVMKFHQNLPEEDHGPPQWHGRRWDHPWEARRCFDKLTVWLPPPEIARDVISFVLNCYVERPNTSGLFFIPRILPAFWRGLSRHIVELPSINPRTADLAYPPLLPIPITVLYLPPHVGELPRRNKLDKAPTPHRAYWHKRQAERMRRVLDFPQEH